MRARSLTHDTLDKVEQSPIESQDESSPVVEDPVAVKLPATKGRRLVENTSEAIGVSPTKT